MSGTFLLVDANNLLMRAIYAVHYRRMKAQVDADARLHAAGALDLFLAMLCRHVRDEAPQRVVLAWDSGPTFRQQLSKDYKANRRQAIDPDAQDSAFTLVKEVAYLLGIPNVAAEGYEADDLIAAFWRGADSRVSQLVILSSDKDFGQLVGSTARGIPCEQAIPSTIHGDRWTLDRVRLEWKCEPDQIPLVKAMAGDSSDNVKGLYRVGPKTAVKRLVKAGWDLSIALQDEDVTDRARVTTNLELVNLREGDLLIAPPVPFVPLPIEHDNTMKVAQMFRELELERHLSQLLSGEMWRHRQDGLVGVPVDLSGLSDLR